MAKTICSGGLANESLFAIILYSCRQLQNVISEVTHAADWSRMMNSTSPYLFSKICDQDIKFIEKTLDQHKYTMFIRKVAPEFPHDILEHYIYEYSREKDEKLEIRDPEIFYKMMKFMLLISLYFLFYCFLYGFTIYVFIFCLN
jgi:hypothetical protein